MDIGICNRSSPVPHFDDNQYRLDRALRKKSLPRSMRCRMIAMMISILGIATQLAAAGKKTLVGEIVDATSLKSKFFMLI